MPGPDLVEDDTARLRKRLLKRMLWQSPDSVRLQRQRALTVFFAATDELVLATDESYAAMLQDQIAAQSQDVSQYLAFHLDDEEYALDIKQISEIIKAQGIYGNPQVSRSLF